MSLPPYKRSKKLSSSSREVICGDSSVELVKTSNETLFSNSSIVFSPPDISEIFERCPTIKLYKEFFRQVLDASINHLTDDQFICAIFTPRYWTEKESEDSIEKLVFLDKANWFTTACLELGLTLVFSKIVLNDNSTRKRTHYCDYTNLVMFRKGESPYNNISEFQSDVLKPRESKSWIKGFNWDIIAKVVKFFKNNGCTKVFDPFCGHGTALKVASDYSMEGVGIEIEEKYCSIARED
ncbi:hypothetical protein GEMRC1_014172 [Eukaryota sp. GEM-RC1]